MNKFSGLSTKLKLAYPPISAYDFTMIKDDESVRTWLMDAKLYMFAQRGQLTFENVNAHLEEKILYFEIHQHGNPEILSCSISVQQPAFAAHGENIDVIVGSYDPAWDNKTLPANQVNGLKFLDDQDNFIMWLSPEKFLYEHWHKTLLAEVVGDEKAFTRYKVLYVGKATDQPIWDRLTGHEKLQDIVILEPTIANVPPAHEIVLLMFNIVDAFRVNIIDFDLTGHDFIESITSALPEKRELALDAEKVLVRCLNPNHNTIKFLNYPGTGKDNLASYNLNRHNYIIQDELTLEYQDGEINCSINENQSDLLTVEANSKITVVKFNDPVVSNKETN